MLHPLKAAIYTMRVSGYGCEFLVECYSVPGSKSRYVDVFRLQSNPRHLLFWRKPTVKKVRVAHSNTPCLTDCGALAMQMIRDYCEKTLLGE